MYTNATINLADCLSTESPIKCLNWFHYTAYNLQILLQSCKFHPGNDQFEENANWCTVYKSFRYNTPFCYVKCLIFLHICPLWLLHKRLHATVGQTHDRLYNKAMFIYMFDDRQYETTAGPLSQKLLMINILMLLVMCLKWKCATFAVAATIKKYVKSCHFVQPERGVIAQRDIRRKKKVVFIVTRPTLSKTPRP